MRRPLKKAAARPGRKLSASLEDYLEAIYGLCQEFSVARVGQIAAKVGVSKSSVTGALKQLARKGYVDYDPYQLIRLTETGRAAAQEIAWRHSVLKRFLIEVLDVEEGLAGETACRMEHLMNRDVLTRVLKFVRFINHFESEGRSWREILDSPCPHGRPWLACEACQEPPAAWGAAARSDEAGRHRPGSAGESES